MVHADDNLTQDISNSLADLGVPVVLAEHANAIRALGKRVITDVIDIGARLSECKRICGHGNWLPWLDREFGWTDDTALNFMRVHELAKSRNFRDLNLPVSSLYALAAPSTPAEARDAVLERAAAGDSVSAAEIKRIIDTAKRGGIVTGVAMHPYAERGFDLYETPEPATRALLAAESFEGTIWEIANGRSAISRVLRAAGYRVVATDLVDYGADDEARGGVDFLAQTSAPEGVTTILTNPPFMHANEFVRHALKLVPRVVLLLRLAFVEGMGRSDVIDGGLLARVYVFRNRLPMIHRDGWDGPRATSSVMPLAWFVWDRQHCGPTELRRISWEANGNEAPPPPAGETWNEMWTRPFDYSKLEGGAS